MSITLESLTIDDRFETFYEVPEAGKTGLVWHSLERGVDATGGWYVVETVDRVKTVWSERFDSRGAAARAATRVAEERADLGAGHWVCGPDVDRVGCRRHWRVRATGLEVTP